MGDTRSDGQQRRIRGLLDKRALEAQKNKLISESLRSAQNGNRLNKKVVFADSDDETETPNSSARKLTLFADGDEPDLEKQDAEELLKNRFTGPNSQRLMELETRFSYDERFKVDDRFADDEVEEEAGEGDRVTAGEKKTEFAILSHILGQSVKSDVVGRAKRTEAVKPFQRFDPDNPDHVKWMQEQSEQLKSSNTPLFDADTFNKELDKSEPKVVDGQFYEVDQDFAKELQQSLSGAGEKQKFSFLSLMGRGERTSTSEDKSIFQISDVVPDVSAKKSAESCPKVDDFEVGRTVESPYLFVYPQHASFMRVLDSFRRQQSLDKIKNAWEKHKAKTSQHYKNLHKKYLRLKQKENKTAIRKSYTKRASKKRADTNGAASDESDE